MSQGAVPVVDQHYGVCLCTHDGGRQVGVVHQVGHATGAQIQLGHLPQDTIAILDDDVGIILGAGHQPGQADAGPHTGGHRAAANSQHTSRPGPCILDGGSTGGAGIVCQQGDVGGAGSAAEDADVRRVGLHAAGNDGEDGAGAAGDEDGACRGIARVTGAMEMVPGSVGRGSTWL